MIINLLIMQVNKIKKYQIQLQIKRLFNFIDRMLNSPRRQRIINYHKQFRRGALTSRDDSKHSISSLNSGNPQFSFNADRRNGLFENYSTCVQQNSLTHQKSTFTINPQQSKKRQYVSVGGQIPLKNKHFSRKKQLLNPQLLMNPRLHDSSDRQLLLRQDIDFDGNSPGNISKNLQLQKPLQKQCRSKISIGIKGAIPCQKVESNQKNFKEIVKSQYISLNREKNEKLGTFSRNSELDNGDKKIKKGSDIQISPTNLYHTKKYSKNQFRTFEQFGHLLCENNVGKLKQQINQLVKDRKKNKQKINEIDESIIQQYHQGSIPISESNKFRTNYLLGSQTIFSQTDKFNFPRRHLQEMNSSRGKKFAFQSKIDFFSAPKVFSEGESKKLTISYKTSLTQLTNIYNNIGRRLNSDIQVLVPKVLMSFYLDRKIQKIELYNKARQIFDSLGIPAENISVKRYSNCIVVISKNICIIWHYNGRLYLGGWQIKYLDEGVKHGLGLQWMPNKYVYYGEYVDSKKTGLGIIKTKDETFIGYWDKGKRSGNGHFINKNGQIFHSRPGTNQEINIFDEDVESDSFM